MLIVNKRCQLVVLTRHQGPGLKTKTKTPTLKTKTPNITNFCAIFMGKQASKLILLASKTIQ